MNKTTDERLFPLSCKQNSQHCWRKIIQQGRLITSWQPPSKALNIIQHSSEFSLITLLPYSLFKPYPLFSTLPMAPLPYHTLKWPSHLLSHIENSRHLKGAPSTHFWSIHSSSPGLHPCSSFCYNRMAICPHFSRSPSCLASMETHSTDSPFFLWYWQPVTHYWNLPTCNQTCSSKTLPSSSNQQSNRKLCPLSTTLPPLGTAPVFLSFLHNHIS